MPHEDPELAQKGGGESSHGRGREDREEVECRGEEARGKAAGGPAARHEDDRAGVTFEVLDRWIDLLESTGAPEIRQHADPGHWLTPEAAQVLREMRTAREMICARRELDGALAAGEYLPSQAPPPGKEQDLL